jgi:zinc transporter
MAPDRAGLTGETEWPLPSPRKAAGEFVWVHLHRDTPDARALLDASGLDRSVIEALVAEDTRPRCTAHGDGVIIILRGVNLNPGAEPDDMVSVRFWVEARQVVGVWLRPLLATSDVYDAIGRNLAPLSPGDLIARFALRLADRAEPVVAALNERIDAMEEAVLNDATARLRAELAEIRRSAIVLRRFMFPQRDALTTLQIEDLSWLDERERGRIREAAERVTRLAEELDAIRDRAAIVHDQVTDQRAEALNRSMLILAVVAAVFLPLGLITGLLGINVGGIPGSDYPYAFEIVCALLVLIAIGQVVVFIRLKLL